MDTTRTLRLLLLNNEKLKTIFINKIILVYPVMEYYISLNNELEQLCVKRNVENKLDQCV